ncbi:MAG: hypothetical protein V4648_00225 [Bacteroidota bacterium]
MKKNSSMITLILALFGCALIMGSVFSLYRSSTTVESNNSFVNDTEIDIANKKIDVLTNEIQETKEQLVENEPGPTDIIKEGSNQFTNQNIPIVEIKDLDLGEGNEVVEPTKKGQRVMYNHQIKISIMNVGKYSLKDVIFSIKDIYNETVDKKKKKASSQYNYMGRTFDNEDLGAYNNIEVNTLNLKTKKLIYVSNLPTSFGVGDYYFDIIVEWNNGFYQMHVDIEELNGKLKYRYQFYDVDGNPIDFKKIQENINA